MRPAFTALLMVTLLVTPAVAKVGAPVEAFASGPLVQQLRLTLTEHSGGLYRYVSDDRVITVDLVTSGGRIEQQIMYLPMDQRRGFQVSMFLQDALGSLVGSQTGMIAYRAAVVDRKETYLTFGGLIMRFTPMLGESLRVLVSR